MRRCRFWVGLDAGEKRVDLCVLDSQGSIVLKQDCDATAAAVRRALKGIPRSRIDAMGIEAGAGTHLVRQLRKLRFPVCIFESRTASRFLAIRRNKTDSNDAKGLADLARLGQQAVSQVSLKSPETQLLRLQLTSRNKLVQYRLAAHSTLRSLLGLHGGDLRTSRTGRDLETKFSHEVRRLRVKSGFDLEPHLRPILEICKEATVQIRQMDRALLELATAHPICSQLMTVPGVGPVCAVSFYTAVEEPTRFTRSSDVGAYFGLTPKVRQSGDVSRIAGISKMGNRLTRGHLVSAATALLWTSKAECDLRTWGLQLKERVGGQRARIAVARKLAIVMLAMWKSGQPFDPRPASRERFGLRRLGESVDSVNCLEAEPLAS